MVTITIPAWMCWALMGWCFISIVLSLVDIYLKRKLNKLRASTPLTMGGIRSGRGH